ncbi:hypothetical protein ACQP2F_40115 [Actinoplanes sp. CA-030573]|uniref:hypothetical protein n=1 Tax=Actinoplanes sp. CA-030573 TaxID=3239898 RepID=UPI003D9213E9
MSAITALFRVYRPIIGWFVPAILSAYLIILAAVLASTPRLGFSMWMVLAVPAAKYWLLVVAIMLVAMQLRQFVTNGVTRHEYLHAVGVFGLILCVAFALAVVLGHVLESALLAAFDRRAVGYPVSTFGGAVSELGHMLPLALAYLVSGALIAAGFYRWRPLAGLVVMVAGAVPVALAEYLLNVDEFGTFDAHLAYAPSLVISLVVTAAGALAFYRVVSDVPIRRTAG